MKKVLIIGQNNYIEQKLKYYLLHQVGGFMVNTTSADLKDWAPLNFSLFDCIIDLVSATAESQKGVTLKDIYFQTNCDLALALAKKAKADGAASFMYLSSIEVYGKKGKFGERITIEKNTKCLPITTYGQSLLAGEKRLRELSDGNFKTIILRVPFLYGPDCPGDFENLKNVLRKYQTLPAIKNHFSALHITTLCAFIQYSINQELSGVFHPQNKDYLSTLDIAKMLAKEENLPIQISKFYALRMKFFKSAAPRELRHLFSSVVYAKNIDQ